MQGDSQLVKGRCFAEARLDTQPGRAVDQTSNLPVTSQPALPPEPHTAAMWHVARMRWAQMLCTPELFNGLIDGLFIIQDQKQPCSLSDKKAPFCVNRASRRFNQERGSFLDEGSVCVPQRCHSSD